MGEDQLCDMQSSGQFMSVSQSFWQSNSIVHLVAVACGQQNPSGIGNSLIKLFAVALTSTTSSIPNSIADADIYSHKIDGNCKVTDLKFNDSAEENNPPERLALSFSSGTLSILSIESGKVISSHGLGKPSSEKLANGSLKVVEEWNAGKTCSCINKVCWNSFEKAVLATANDDGVVRIYDIRSKEKAIYHTQSTTPNCSQRSTLCFNKTTSTDISFHPFNSHM